MMKRWTILTMIVWVACGVWNYGVTVAYFQHEYPQQAASRLADDRLFGLSQALQGPIGTISSSLYIANYGGWHGWKL